jgi:hypothetical protein
MKTEEIFLKEIAAELKTQTGFNDVEQLFFPLRFDKNRPTLYKHTEIAENLMRPEGSKLPLDFYSKAINQTVQNIVNIMVGRLEKRYPSKKDGNKETIKPAIKGIYETEMRTDGVHVDSLLNKKQGERGNWEVVYHWLWQHKYPRWLEANSWDILRENATSPAKWIQFLTEEDKQKVVAGETRVRRPSPPASAQKITEKIPVNQPLYLEVNLEYPQHRLLLVNGNTEGKYLFCPSLDFAPDSIVENPPFVLPQSGSWAEQNGNNEKIFFEDVRREEFMAIILDKDINFDWMKPSEEESLPEWNGERILDVFNHLEQSGEWQVFYQSFEVVESETKADNVDNG